MDVDLDYTNKLKRKRSQTPDGSSDDGASRSLEDVRQLLDVSLLANDADICSRFDEIADALLNDFSLSLTAGGEATELEILELEFYLQKSGCHEDPFTHGSEEQRCSGQWYFHRSPTRSTHSHSRPTPAGGYRGGTRKGLDLTIGGPATGASPYFSEKAPGDDFRGGILLRTLRRKPDSKIVSGPSLLVDEILRLSGGGSVSDLVNQAWGGDISAFPHPGQSRSTSLHLCPKTSRAARLPVYRSPRIGLDLSQAGMTTVATHPRVVYISKPYRYFVLPKLLTANGRSQTFLGVYRACLGSGEHDSGGDSLRRELVGLTGLSEAVVMRYMADYKSGEESGHLRSFVGPAGKGAAASPSTYLRMMGTLDRLGTKTSEEGSLTVSPSLR